MGNRLLVGTVANFEKRVCEIKNTRSRVPQRYVCSTFYWSGDDEQIKLSVKVGKRPSMRTIANTSADMLLIWLENWCKHEVAGRSANLRRRSKPDVQRCEKLLARVKTFFFFSFDPEYRELNISVRHGKLTTSMQLFFFWLMPSDVRT